jgi:hypothetical protein
MPTPTFEQLQQFRVDYVDSWNQGDKERFAANWRQFLADDDAFEMFDPVGTPMKRGLVECALDPFDLWQPVVRFNVPEETFFICGNEIAWVMENLFDDGGTERKSSSIENYTFTEDRAVRIRTWYIVPAAGPLAETMQEYLPEGGPNQR